MDTTGFLHVFKRNFVGYFGSLRSYLFILFPFAAALAVATVLTLLTVAGAISLDSCNSLLEGIRLPLGLLVPVALLASIFLSASSVRRAAEYLAAGGRADRASAPRPSRSCVALGEFAAGTLIYGILLVLAALVLAVSLAWQSGFADALVGIAPNFTVLLVVGAAFLAMGVSTTLPTRTVFLRNFVSYFANPTGYVFTCVFVLLSTISAFWPNEFFNTNLANLDQLNQYFPFIMLFFVPAISMGVWADERRQGTDELLLTIPAGDYDIVIGKYLAAVAIYTVALWFSLLCHSLVLDFLGDPDVGLLLGTYIGYWLVGLAMLAIGMVASFLTSNLTIAYILGAALNVPLVFAAASDVIAGRQVAMALKQWSIGEQFRDFGRGIVSFSGVLYFASIVAVMLYLSVVLIGRRHWREAQGKLPNPLFYSLLHFGWLLSFAGFWVVLKAYFDQAGWALSFAGLGIDWTLHLDAARLLVCLATIYLVLHAGLLWGWSRARRPEQQTALDAVVAACHLMVVAGFVVFALLLDYYEAPSWLLVTAFVLYLLLHVGLALAWLFYAGHVAMLPGQYTVRVGALVLIAAGAVLFFDQHDWRWDVTSERLSSLSPYTLQLVDEVRAKAERPVKIEAFISPQVPESYVETRLNLISMLQELAARGGDKVDLQIYDTERFTEEAARAEKRYDITPREVGTLEQGAYSREFLVMGVAFTCGLEKVVLPFIDRGIPVEYELVRSLSTVAQPNLKRAKSIEELDLERTPVLVTALVSPELPGSLEKTRSELKDALAKLQKLDKEQVRVEIDEHADPSSPLAAKLDVKPYRVPVQEEEKQQGKEEAKETEKETAKETADDDAKEPAEVFLHVALRCGKDKRVISLASRENLGGQELEAELASAISAISEQSRRRIGVVDTDARLFGGFNMQTMSGSSNWPIIDELKKQYDVERVNAAEPIPDEYDALLAVQPSSLGPEQMDHFVSAIRRGVPTAIFEDPLPIWANMPATTEPRRPPGGMNPYMMRGQPPMEKGNLFELLDLLEVNFSDIPEPQSKQDRREPRIVWQDYNPYPTLGTDFPEEFVFAAEGAVEGKGNEEPFNEQSAVTSGLQQVLFPFPGFITKKNVSDLNFTPLVRTGERTGTVDSDQVFGPAFFGPRELNSRRRHRNTGISYVLAAHITGKVKPAVPAGDDHADGDGDDAEKGGDEASDSVGSEASAGEPQEHEINVVLVADVDMLHRNLFMLRERGADPEAGIHFDFDNVTFILNVLDMLAGDTRFLEIRKRRPKHRTLTRVEQQTDKARKDTAKEVEEKRNEYEDEKKAADKEVDDFIDKLKAQYEKDPTISAGEAQRRLDMMQADRNRRKLVRLGQLERETERDVERIQTDLNIQIQRLQYAYKMWAVLLPPIPPLVVAVVVFITRRMREREGVARSRLRS